MMPYMIGNTQSDIQRGFDQSAIMSGLNGINTAVANGFANAEISRCNGQLTTLQAINTLGYNQQNCCCENRLATANLAADLAREACADRAAVADGIRDVLAATQAQTQAILDKMCQQEIDALKERNASLQNQVLMKDLAASQAAQTAALVADNTAQTQYIVNRVAPYPIPAYTVANPVTPVIVEA